MPENAGSREFTGAAMFVPVNDDGRVVIIDHISEAVYDRITDTLLRSGYTDLTRFADNTYYKNEEEIS